jgi:hypothetical protein
MSVETEVEKVATEVKDEVVKVAEEVKAAIVPEAKKLKVTITTEEQLFLRNVEADFLRAQVTIRDLQSQVKDAANKAAEATKIHSAKVEELAKKYALDTKEYVFDHMEAVFNLIKKA